MRSASSRSKTTWLAVLALLTVLLVPWFVQRQARQKRLDQALVTAILKNDPGAVRKQLAQGADANAVWYHAESQSLWQKLLGPFSRKRTPEPFTTPLVIATQALPFRLDPDIVPALVEYGADPNLSPSVDHTPLSQASAELGRFYKDFRPIQMMIKRGAQVNVRLFTGETPLMMCAQDADTVRLLLEQGADVHATDKGGMTALMHASQYEATDSVHLLLAKGARVNARASGGITALGQAVFWRHPEVVRVLLENGATTSPYLVHIARTRVGKSTLASDRANATTILSLLQKGEERRKTAPH